MTSRQVSLAGKLFLYAKKKRFNSFFLISHLSSNFTNPLNSAGKGQLTRMSETFV